MIAASKVSDWVKILSGDCRETLKALPDKSVHCVITSPPYWGLRRYCKTPELRALEIGSEATLQEHLQNLLSVFAEVWRVLRYDGTLWLNYGDVYAQGGRGGSAMQSTNRGNLKGSKKAQDGFKPKDLMMLPHRLAIALQDAGWYVRQDIVWNKPACMPESCSDRPTRSHEYVFLLTKSPKYFYDAVAIAEPCSASTHARVSQNVMAQAGSDRANGGAKTNGKMKAVVKKCGKNSRFNVDRDIQHEGRVKQQSTFSTSTLQLVSTRNKRSVWTIAAQGTKDAHFATFPEALVKPCLLAGTSALGVCVTCGSPWVRSKPDWIPSCKCDLNTPVPAVVLDPFGGSGTVAKVAIENGRHAILCELNPDYMPIIHSRTNVTPSLPISL